MSKQFDSKKEAALTLKKFYSALGTNSEKTASSETIDYKSKYNLLLKRFRELEKVFDFHRGLIQNISSGLVTINMQAEITFMNRAALRIFGYEYLSTQGMPVASLFADRNEAETIIDTVLNKQNMLESKEVHFITKNGEIFPVGFTTSLLMQPEQNQIAGVLFVFKDISDTTNLRHQIERMDRLATLGELSAGIAHEIRNPLAGIKSSAQVLEESFSPGDFRAQLASRIVKEIDRSNELLKRFFNFARPSKPMQDWHNVEMILDGVYLLMAPRFKKKNISFKKDFAENLPQVYVDESQIEQVILNLFLNAVDAMPEGGSISVKTSLKNIHDPLTDKIRERQIVVTVADSGRGIPPEKIEKIFNPFYTSKNDGVGLGLSISTRLLEENGGRITVESELGKGAIFSIFLPVTKDILG